MATIFWDGEEVILVDIKPHGQTINSDLYTVSPKTTHHHFRSIQTHSQKFAEILLQHDKV
jgi:hypothetical protein